MKRILLALTLVASPIVPKESKLIATQSVKQGGLLPPPTAK
ncbi:hypothetical protein [Stutzerimonas stutzeri]|nr:hypothetical protein [Stutzerimonas stutzeri]